MTAGRALPVMMDQPAAEILGADRRDRRPRAASGTKPAAGVIVVDRSERARRRRVRPPLPPAFDVPADMGGIGESHVRSPLAKAGAQPVSQPPAPASVAGDLVNMGCPSPRSQLFLA